MNKKFKLISIIILYISGFVIVGSQSWLLALGIFLLLIANNLEQSL